MFIWPISATKNVFAGNDFQESVCKKAFIEEKRWEPNLANQKSKFDLPNDWV
jgi:hypothetical protein